MEKRSIGYEALRVYVRFAFWLTHRRVIVIGRDLIPKNQPIIFAANHQNALMDPLALVCTNPLQTLWLARADIFKSGLTKPILKFMKMLPIYRIRDGKENLNNNEEVFDLVTKVLKNGGSTALFPEAAHSGKRQMLPHKKAIPRIALEAEAKNQFQLGIRIVPVGIYYDHYWHFNRTLMVQYGESIGINQYRERWAENAQNTMIALRDEIQCILQPLTMQINSTQYYQDYEDIRMVATEEYSHYHFFNSNPWLQEFHAGQEFVNEIEKFQAEQPEGFDLLRKSCTAYINGLKKFGYSNAQVVKAGRTGFYKLPVQFCKALITSPLLVAGFLACILPYALPRVLLAGKVKDPAFKSTFIFVSGLLLFPIFFLLESLLIGILSGSVMVATISFAAMPFLGKFAFHLFEFDQNLLKMFKLKTVHKSIFLQLGKARLAVLELVPGKQGVWVGS
ncbi:MAG: 1-acyl-sn-glycerol-3-phosphate acyltransferase [Prolixibacteraceae bacterium]|jgi:1-acyl-sn-glycerol-3-phosphate acyltransferase|nr:1-acyl-sn-glycerol-3-phosphate acyltransferase [Prolixibacteraceae bacterium]